MAALLRPARRRAGLTLAEMTLVVAVLGVAAAIALPNANPVSAPAADAAAGEIASALRFAQREAVRTGIYHAVSVDPATRVLRVYRLTSSGDEDKSTQVMHPVDKREYSITLSNNPATNTTVVSAVFKYQNGGTTNYASFGPDGSPAYATSAQAKDIKPLQADGAITIRHGSVERVVKVAPVTGRVTF
jgi:prepilin-type N-terminal cleavage/methylation domain-containing protein